MVVHTKFSREQLIEIGERLIDAFGNYHRLFSNCQVFAKCYLRLITGGKNFDKCVQKYDINADSRLKFADATHLFLCGLIVTVPTATSLRLAHQAKTKSLEERMTDFMKRMHRLSEEDGM